MEDSALTAGLVACVIACVKVVEKLAGKNGGSVEHRLGALENEISELNEKLSMFRREFFEIKQRMIVRWARDDALAGKERDK